MTIYMGTTKISPERTAAEIQHLLGSKGARHILTEYENGEVSALSFTIPVRGKEVAFRLPVRWRNYYELLKQDYRSRPRAKLPPTDQAKRTAWRVVLRWIQAQFALIETEMASLDEVMLPYAIWGEQTLYERLAENQFKLLEGPQ